MQKKNLLINPISLVHVRNMAIFQRFLPEFKIKSIQNPHFPWFMDGKNKCGDETIYFEHRHFQTIPKNAFEDTAAVILFTAQSRIPPANIIEQAAMKRIPVIAVEEVYMMMLEQELVNNYELPVDHLFAASEYEREKFIETGVPNDVIRTIGNIFRYKQKSSTRSRERERIKKELGILPNKPVATLGMALLAPNGDTVASRKELLKTLSEGLPNNYEFLIKPHPSEHGKDFENFIKENAPRAKLSPASWPIDMILDITDILFNRGNSQVIVDALQRNIPAVAVPVGRKTFFRGIIDDVVVTQKEDVISVLNRIEKCGMNLYENIFKTHLSITPEAALDKAVNEIRNITRINALYNPEKRLFELSLFWAWMGYPGQALRTLEHLRNIHKDKSLLESASRLISKKAEWEDIDFLKSRCRERYITWIIQSLWVKELYDREKAIDPRSQL